MPVGSLSNLKESPHKEGLLVNYWTKKIPTVPWPWPTEISVPGETVQHEVVKKGRPVWEPVCFCSFVCHTSPFKDCNREQWLTHSMKPSESKLGGSGSWRLSLLPVISACHLILQRFSEKYAFQINILNKCIFSQKYPFSFAVGSSFSTNRHTERTQCWLLSSLPSSVSTSPAHLSQAQPRQLRRLWGRNAALAPV